VELEVGEALPGIGQLGDHQAAAAVDLDGVAGRVGADELALHAAGPAVDRFDVSPAGGHDVDALGPGADHAFDAVADLGVERLIEHEVKAWM